jgi:L-fucose dehydrogenase
MNLGIEGNVVVVTGGASGIGAAITRVCVEEGARVVVLTRLSAGVPEFMAEMQQRKFDVALQEIELGEADSCRKAIERVAAEYGKIDALVNNAGVNDGVGLASGTPEKFEQSLRVNLLPAYVLTHHALQLLKKSKGSVVNIASKVAMTGQGNTSGYAAAKGGLLALTREWAAELLNDGVRVNAVVPSEVMTPAYKTWLETLTEPDETRAHIEDQIPLGHRMTRTDEIAAAVVFLLSPTKSGHTTGQQLVVDGGYVHLDRMLTAAPLRKS